jgi:co-chaperonin GroES (HSP10)
MQSFPINLIGELVAVQPNPAESRISLPDWKRALNGKILAVGPEVQSAKCGDTVYFGAAVGMDSVFSGQEIRILKEQDIDFIYEQA